MKKFALVVDNEVKQVGGLPTNWNNISNFYLLNPEDKTELAIIKQNGWFPVQTVSDDKEIQEKVEYVIGKNAVKEIITTRDKTQVEIDKENQSQLDAKWHFIRIKRNNLLKESDIEIAIDRWEAMDKATKTSWTTYRQELRNIPQTFSTPEDVIWPTKP